VLGNHTIKRSWEFVMAVIHNRRLGITSFPGRRCVFSRVVIRLRGTICSVLVPSLSVPSTASTLAAKVSGKASTNGGRGMQGGKEGRG
jgi:hypothetical protein